MILTMCLPILDRFIFATKDKPKKMHLEPNKKREVKVTDFKRMEEFKKTCELEEICSGPCCNVIRTIAERTNINTVFMGPVGDDDVGMTIYEKLSHERITPRLEEFNNESSTLKSYLVYDNEWTKIAVLGTARHLSQDYIDKNKRLIACAKVIYICASFAQYMSENASSIISMIDTQELIFNLSGNDVVGLIDINLLQNIVIKSKVIIGSDDDMEELRIILFNDKYQTVIDMIIGEFKNKKLIIAINMDGNVQFALDEGIGSVFDKNFATEKLEIEGVTDHFAAGFVSEYYKLTESTNKCVLKGVEWANDFLDSGYEI